MSVTKKYVFALWLALSPAMAISTPKTSASNDENSYTCTLFGCYPKEATAHDPDTLLGHLNLEIGHLFARQKNEKHVPTLAGGKKLRTPATQKPTWVSYKTRIPNKLTLAGDVILKVDPRQRAPLKMLAPFAIASKKRGALYITTQQTRLTNDNDFGFTQRQQPTLPKNKPNVIINDIRQVRHLELFAHARIEAKTSHLRPLRIDNYSDQKQTFKGRYNFSHLGQYGPGSLEAYWVDSKNLKIKSSNGYLKLAGTAQQLEITSIGTAFIDAQHLRAQSILLGSGDNASVQITPLKHLYAFASGNSEIQYYKRPLVFETATMDRGHFAYMFVNSMLDKSLINEILQR